MDAETEKTASEAPPEESSADEADKDPSETSDADKNEGKSSTGDNGNLQETSNGDVEASDDASDEQDEPVSNGAGSKSEDKKASSPETRDANPNASKDPFVGKTMETSVILPIGVPSTLEGKVVSYQEQSGRLPPRWKVQYAVPGGRMAEEYVLDELKAYINGEETEASPGPALSAIEERHRDHVAHALVNSDLMSTLLVYAAMEEALQSILHEQENPAQSSSNKGGRTKKNPHPPLYYTKNPSSYMQAPTATDTTPSTPSNSVQFTPASLAQRVRAGTEWAWSILEAKKPPPPVVEVTSSGRPRRSTRQPTKPAEDEINHPTMVQRGGRVAMWLLKKLEEESKRAQEEEKKVKLESPKKSPKKVKKEAGTPEPETKEEEESKEPVEEEEEPKDASEEEESVAESKSKDDDDEDFDSNDVEDEEDEELEDVEVERGRLSPVHDGTDDEEEEEEEDIEDAILYENPYFKPGFESILEYLARPRIISGEMVQEALCEAILRVKHNKRTAENGVATSELESIDEFVLEQETPDFPTGRVVVKCVSGESFADLKNLEAQAFARCKFVLDVVGDQEKSHQIKRKEELLQQELIFKEQKAWEKWRFRGINEGSSNWSSWIDAISESTKGKYGVSDTAEAEAASPSATAETKSDDEALAKKLEAAEEEPSGRRRTRRAVNPGSSEGVFYGNQSQLTQKQLMDALLRLIKASQCQTLLGLQGVVAEDSSDPIRRCRAGLGKLLWKQNQIVRLETSTDLSDSKALKELSASQLLTIGEKEDSEDEMEDEEPYELSEMQKALVAYVKDLHVTELRLRQLILRHLAESPLAIIATAADERLSSTEALDASQFEDQSSIEWLAEGHDFIGKLICRPEAVEGTTDMSECVWFRIRDYSKSVKSDGEEASENPLLMKRRMRFRADAAAPPGADYTYEGDMVILTEAQVQAGLKAAEIEKKRLESEAAHGNPFSGGSGDKVSLVPVEIDEGADATDDEEISGRIIGHDNVLDEDDDTVEHRILFLPDASRKEQKEAFWATLDVRADTSSFICQPSGSKIWYAIEHFDYNPGTEAFRECQNIVKYLQRQSKIGPFMEPVDPVALNIPNYFSVVKNPMDVSTLSEKLENSHYSSVPPGQSSGKSPVSRMLNGPFRKDVELIFDNAMAFNPPDDWIHVAAAHVKKNVLKKIADVSFAADQKSSGSRSRQRRSVYIDDGSDVDMYEYESDEDDDYNGGRKRKRKGKRKLVKDDYHSRAIENAIRLQATLREANDLRGPFANLPINMEVSSFSLQPKWSCRPSEKQQEVKEESNEKRSQEIAELVALQKQVAATEVAGLRRSTRAHIEPTRRTTAKDLKVGFLSSVEEEHRRNGDATPMPRTRLDVEVHQEQCHEEFYAALYQEHASMIISTNKEGLGEYSNGSFPPYLGRVVPIGPDEVSWEIRDQFVVPAMRWVLRGLMRSGHISAIEPMVVNQSPGVIIANHVYCYDSNLKPFEQLDVKELQREKRANREADASESEDEVELSEYEQLRAQRVARNAERLRMLGLG